MIKNHRLYLFHSIFQLRGEIAGCAGESANKRLKGLRLRVLGRCALQNAATVSMDIGYGRWGSYDVHELWGSKAKPVMQ